MAITLNLRPYLSKLQAAPQTYKYPLLLSLIWLVGICLVGVGGDFPLNDDWAYAHNVYHLSEHNTIKFSDWPAMTLLAQMYWGALFTKLFGFSFVVLRISSLVIGWIGILALYQLLLEQSKEARFAFLGGLLLMFNPLFFSLSYTFMTDVPFLSVAILSLLFFSRALEHADAKNIFLGTLFAIITILIRQLGIIIPFFFLVAFIHKKGFKPKVLLAALSPFVLTLLVHQLATWWRVHYYGVPPNFGKLEHLLEGIWNGYFFRNLTWRPGILLVYCGYFILPISLVLVPILWKRAANLHRGIVLTVVSLFVFAYSSAWNMLPVGNIFYDFGLGPKVLKDTFNHANISPTLPDWGFVAFKSIGFVAASLLLALFILNFFQNCKAKSYLGSWAAILGYSMFLHISPFFFDRYYLFLFPFLILLTIPKNIVSINPRWWKISIGLIAIYALFSIGLSHDYLSWNKARWQALNSLINIDNVSPNQIDGGFEFNGWYQTKKERGSGDKGAPSWWFVDQDDYVVSFGAIAGFVPYRSYAFQSWLPYRMDSIYVLQKPKLTITDTIFCNAETILEENKLLANSKYNTSIKMGNGYLRDSSRAFSGKFSLALSPQNAFAYTCQIPNIKVNERLLISIWRHQQSSEGFLVASGQDYYENMATVVRDSGEWQCVEHEFIVPTSIQSDTVTVYYWNNSEDSVWVDDLQIILKQY